MKEKIDMEKSNLPEDNMSEASEFKEKEPFKVRGSSINNEKRFSSREASARKTRISDERPPIVFGGGSRFNLNAKVVKKLQDSGKVVGFVVYSSGNVEQKENYNDALDRGWRPLDAREFPELARQYELSPFGVKEEDYLVRRGGQIAMIRDKEIDDAEKEYYDSERHRQEIMASMYKQSDPRYPKPFIDERTSNRVRF